MVEDEAVEEEGLFLLEGEDLLLELGHAFITTKTVFLCSETVALAAALFGGKRESARARKRVGLYVDVDIDESRLSTYEPAHRSPRRFFMSSLRSTGAHPVSPSTPCNPAQRSALQAACVRATHPESQVGSGKRTIGIGIPPGRMRPSPFGLPACAHGPTPIASSLPEQGTGETKSVERARASSEGVW